MHHANVAMYKELIKLFLIHIDIALSSLHENQKRYKHSLISIIIYVNDINIASVCCKLFHNEFNISSSFMSDNCSFVSHVF